MSGVFLYVEASPVTGALRGLAGGVLGMTNSIRRAFGFRANANANVNITEINGLLARIRRKEDLQQPLREIGQLLVTEADLAFRTETDPWGNAWRPLSSVTTDRRRGSSAQILRDTARMANSIHAQVTGTKVTVGTNVIYAAVHQFGNPRNKMYNTPNGHPAPISSRAFFPVGENLQPKLEGTDILEGIIDVLRFHVQNLS